MNALTMSKKEDNIKNAFNTIRIIFGQLIFFLGVFCAIIGLGFLMASLWLSQIIGMKYVLAGIGFFGKESNSVLGASFSIGLGGFLAIIIGIIMAVIGDSIAKTDCNIMQKLANYFKSRSMLLDLSFAVSVVLALINFIAIIIAGNLLTGRILDATLNGSEIMGMNAIDAQTHALSIALLLALMQPFFVIATIAFYNLKKETTK